jgi:hypothetical protein
MSLEASQQNRSLSFFRESVSRSDSERFFAPDVTHLQDSQHTFSRGSLF